MTSRKCLFNFKLFVKCLFQQKYVMLIHTAVLLLSTTLIAYLLYSNYSADRYTDGLSDVAELICFRNPLIIFMIIGASFISAFFGFSHFYKRNSSVMFGAMPVKRSSMFITKLSACLVSVILPVLLVLVVNIIAVNMMDLEVEAGELCARLGYILLQYILYTSIFSFAAVVSGNGFAQLITAGFICLVYPVTYLITAGVIDVALDTWVADFNPDMGYMFPAVYIMDGDIAVRYYVFSAIVAFCAILAGFFLYIKRKNENSGEFYSFRFVNVILKYFISVCTALLAYLLVKAMFGYSDNPIPFVIGIMFGVITFVILQGIFEKSFKAMFSKLRWTGLAVVVIVLVLALPEFDIFGIDRRVGNIEKAEISVFDANIYDSHGSEFVITLDSPEGTNAFGRLAEKRVSIDYYSTDIRFVEAIINDNSFGFRRRFTVPEEDYNEFVKTVYNSEDYKEDYIAYINDRADKNLWSIEVGVGGVHKLNKKTTEELSQALAEDMKKCSYDDVHDSVIVSFIHFEPYRGYHYNGRVPVYSCYEKACGIINEKYPGVHPEDYPGGLLLNGYVNGEGCELLVTDEAEIEQILSYTGLDVNRMSEDVYSADYSVTSVEWDSYLGVIAQKHLPRSVAARISAETPEILE